jgi:hypothetical protein
MVSANVVRTEMFMGEESKTRQLWPVRSDGVDRVVRAFLMRNRRLARVPALAVMGLTLVASCQSDRAMASTEFPVRVVIQNELLAPVTISVDGTPHAGIRGGSSTGLTVSSTAQWLSWISAKPMDAHGQPIPDDINEVKVPVGGLNLVMEITNIIGDQTYVSARVYNFTKAPVSIGVYDGSSVSCASELPAGSDDSVGFTQIGYYRLLPVTEIRAYRDPSHCTGPYFSWPSTQLKGFAPKSGLLNLALETAP